MKQVNEQGESIINLESEATRRARERKNMWVVISCAIVGAISPALTALLIAFHAQNHVATTNCVTNPLTPSVTTCQFPAR